MVIQTEKIINDSRIDARINEKKRVLWQIKEKDQWGMGAVRNISSSGMMIETSSSFVPSENCTFSFDSDLGHNNFIPQTGRLVWHRKKRLLKSRYELGVKFVEPTEFVHSKLRERIEKGLIRFKKLKRFEAVLNVVLIGVIIGLLGFALWQSNVVYQNMETANSQMVIATGQQADIARIQLEQIAQLKEEVRITKQQYIETESQLSSVSAELEAARAVLVQTEELLAQANQQNSQLMGEMQTAQNLSQAQLQETKVELEKTIADLQAKNTQVAEEMLALKAQLSLLSGDIANTQEGQDLLKTYKKRMKLVKMKIKGFKREAYNTRLAAIKERDRLKSMIGNNGFFVKEGAAVNVDLDKYNALTMESIKHAEPAAADRSVQVDVQFHK